MSKNIIRKSIVFVFISMFIVSNFTASSFYFNNSNNNAKEIKSSCDSINTCSLNFSFLPCYAQLARICPGE